MSDAFFEQLMKQLDPHQARNETQRQAQIFCGRYLALRRLGKAMTLEQLAAQAEITPQQLLFLETGLADAELLSAADASKLVAALTTDTEERTLLAQVLAIALGQVPAPDQPVMAQVIEELGIAGN